MMKWIDIYDEMPPLDLHVLVCIGYADSYRLIEQGHLFVDEKARKSRWLVSGGIIDNDSSKKTGHVTHWMPIIYPPERGDKD